VRSQIDLPAEIGQQDHSGLTVCLPVCAMQDQALQRRTLIDGEMTDAAVIVGAIQPVCRGRKQRS
jgi:hypothetical protein